MTTKSARRPTPAFATTLVPEFFDPLALDEELDALKVAAGGAVATALKPPVTAPVSVSVASPVPIFSAAAWNSWNVFPDDGALILPTIPRPQ